MRLISLIASESALAVVCTLAWTVKVNFAFQPVQSVHLPIVPTPADINAIPQRKSPRISLYMNTNCNDYESPKNGIDYKPSMNQAVEHEDLSNVLYTISICSFIVAMGVLMVSSGSAMAADSVIVTAAPATTAAVQTATTTVVGLPAVVVPDVATTSHHHYSASSSSSSSIILDDLVMVLGFLWKLVGLVFNLFLEVIKVVLPIFGKAVVAGGKAAAPVLQDGAQAAWEYTKVAAKASGEAVAPYLDEASEAAAPYLELMGSTVNDVADVVAGQQVSVPK